MGNLVAGILNVNALLAYVLVGGVMASRGSVQLSLMIAIVILAAIVGDTVGYEIGKHFGDRILQAKVLNRRRTKLERAQDLLRRRGGSAVFLGRFVAFFRAMMPALAGAAHMPYPRFLGFNVAGGIVWGAAFVMLGYLAGNSYAVVAKTAGQGVAAGVGIIVIAALIGWHSRKRLRDRRQLTDDPNPPPRQDR